MKQTVRWIEVAKSFGLLALWGVPSLWAGITTANFLIMSLLYGVEPVWSGAIRMTKGKPFIRLSNGDEFHGVPLLFWGLATFVILVPIGFLWLRVLIWISKRICPPLYASLTRILPESGKEV
jgi:hypothetical protein